MIQLGTRVRDLITGMTGVAIARTEWLYGCARVGVESVEIKKDGKPSDAVWLDEQRVEAVDGEKAFTPVTPQEYPIKLGSKIKDKLTGFSGLAVAKTVWFSGSTTFQIEPTTMHEGKPVEAHCFEAQRVELIEEAAPPVSKNNSATSGGPQNDPKFR